MREEIFIHRYTLHSRKGLNSRSDDTTHDGLLVRINDGVGCIHPWSIFGDPSVEEVIQDLQYGRLFRPLVRSAVLCAKIDGDARRAGVSAFSGLAVPQSHATIVGGQERVEAAISAGFSTVKIKAGRNSEAEVEMLNAVHQQYPELRWRLDFNNVMGWGEIRTFLDALSPSIYDKIDFLEDPCRVDDERAWQGLHDRYSIPLAVDRKMPEHDVKFQYAVVKPAVDDLEKVYAHSMMQDWKLVLTSYMDHPIGQCYAAWCAANVDRRYDGLLDPVAGLMTHGLFQPDAFIEQMAEPSPNWVAPAGTGFGFDQLVENLPWKKI